MKDIDEFIKAMDIQKDQYGHCFVNGSVKGNVEGDVKGSVEGDVKGSVWGDVKGSVWGNVCGSVGGDVWGNVEGDVCGSVGGAVKGNVKGDVGPKASKASKAPKASKASKAPSRSVMTHALLDYESETVSYVEVIRSWGGQFDVWRRSREGRLDSMNLDELKALFLSLFGTEEAEEAEKKAEDNEEATQDAL